MMTVIHLLELFMFGGNHEMMTIHHAGPQLIGETVIISYLANPSVGHGQFRLENPGDVVMTVTVEEAWLEFGGRRQVLSSITLFDLDQEQPLNPTGFTVDKKATVTFLLGFPSVTYEPRFGEPSAVGLRLGINGIHLHALSPLKFVRRIPHRL
jgi:hypothetical protein